MNHQKRDFGKINISPDIVRKAEEGDARSQLELGKVYLNAVSVENHDTIAFEWISLSAEQGNMEAQFRLGDLYSLGYGTAKSLFNSYKWYTRAAIQGYKKALIRIHNLYQEDKRMHCRGQLNSEEQEWISDKSKEEIYYKELFEYRLKQKRNILNYATEYYARKFRYCQSLDQKDPVFQLHLAFLYQHGYGTRKNSRWAFEYYLLAAEQGNTDAQYNLGRLYQQHTDKKFNIRDAFKWYTRSAQGGNMAAQRCLAYFYLKGLATDINYEVAVFWYTKAAEAGDAQSQVTLGMLYRKGDYIKQDLLIAVSWYTQAARQGNIVAQNCLSQLYQRGMINDIELEQDMLEYITHDSMNSRLCSKLSLDVSKMADFSKSKEIDKLVKRALIGDGSAMFKIGLMYCNGNRWFSQDKDTGITWIKNAANRKYENAQFLMAKLYKEGDLIEQDYCKSFNWYKSIAKQKNADAQFQVGFLYHNEEGARRDSLEASKWFIRAAERENSYAQQEEAEDWLYKSAYQRNIWACYTLGKIMFDGTDGFEKNLKTGLKLLEFAARHRYVSAQLFLGNAYKKGTDVQQDISKSIKYYTMAANSGNEEAQYKLAEFYLNGDGVDHDYIKAYKLFKLAKDRNHEKAKNLLQNRFFTIKENKYRSKVIDMFTEVTRNGIDNLSFNIGSIYEDSEGDENYIKAKKWYLAASYNGDSRADCRLGIMYEDGIGTEKNIAAAISYYIKAVERDNADAMNKLADIYLNGNGINQNVLEAYHLYIKAANIGHWEAKRTLKVLEPDPYIARTRHYFDDSDDSDDANDTEYIYKQKRINMLEEVTGKGYTRLQYQLGVMHERNDDYSKAFKWINLAADIGVTDAYYRLGVMYEEGRSVEQNYGTAAEMYQKATEKDHEDACFRLGKLYLYGNGVELNYLTAYDLYKKAADMGHGAALKILNITQEINIKINGDIENFFFDISSKEYQDSLTMCKSVAEHGNPDVQFNVGFACEYCYSEPDYEEAFRWYLMAAKHSHREAMYHLGLLYEKGSGISQDYHKANQLYNQAYQLGSDDALHRLATIYHYGKGVEIDPVKAIEFYTQSAEIGNPKYQCKLGRFYEEGELVQKNLTEALKWYTKAYLQGYDDIGSKIYALYEYKPYEDFFFERLFQNLSVASCNYFSLNDNYKYEDFIYINTRLGFMCFLGIGTNRNLKQALQYFLKKYTNCDKKNTLHFILSYKHFSIDQKVKIFEEFGNDEEVMDQFSPEEHYMLGMVFYEGKIKFDPDLHYFKHFVEKYIFNFIEEEDDLYGPIQHTVIKKNYLKASSYFKPAADKNYPPALFQLGVMYHCGHGVTKDNIQGEAYFDLVPRDNNKLIGEMAVLYHTHYEIQNFSKAFECYKHLEKALTDAKINEFDFLRRKQTEIIMTVHLGLGLLYEYGDGVEQDYQKALDYYKKSAENDNNPIGKLRLELMYYYGKGVPIDYGKALDLKYTSASIFCWGRYPYVYDQNDLQTDDHVDAHRKLVYCTKTVSELRGEMYYYKGLMYKRRQGDPKDEKKAQKCFRKALDSGFQLAENEIKN